MGKEKIEGVKGRGREMRREEREGDRGSERQRERDEERGRETERGGERVLIGMLVCPESIVIQYACVCVRPVYVCVCVFRAELCSHM